MNRISYLNGEIKFDKKILENYSSENKYYGSNYWILSFHPLIKKNIFWCHYFKITWRRLFSCAARKQNKILRCFSCKKLFVHLQKNLILIIFSLNWKKRSKNMGNSLIYSRATFTREKYSETFFMFQNEKGKNLKKLF